MRPLTRWITAVLVLALLLAALGAAHLLLPGGLPHWLAAHAPWRARSGDLYYCPMHPQYTSDRPGDCPICNMKLVPMKGQEKMTPENGKGAPPEGTPSPPPSSTAPPVEGRAALEVTPWQQQMIGLETGTVERKQVKRTVRTVGKVEFSEKKLSAVSLKFGGWVEELYVKATGERVKKGDRLFSINSPELLEHEWNYLLILEAKKQPGAGLAPGGLGHLQQSFRSGRLLLRDLTEEQIRKLEETKEPPEKQVILSRVEGVVIKRNLVQGAYVEPGRNLFELAETSPVWIHAAIFEYEIPLVKVGQEAEVLLASFPGEPLRGQVVYVDPFLNEEARTARARLEVPNPQELLKPGMFAEVSLACDLGEHLVVDSEAVLDTGLRQIAFVDLGEGRFEPREVKVGGRADGLVIIREGLREGEKVVVSGNFLVDAESRLRWGSAAARKRAAEAMEGGEGSMRHEGAQPEAGGSKPKGGHRH